MLCLVRERRRAQGPAAGWAVAVGVGVFPLSVLVLAFMLVLVLVFVLVLLLLLLVLVVVVVVVVAVLTPVLRGRGSGLFGEGWHRRGGHREHGLFDWRRLFTWTERRIRGQVLYYQVWMFWFLFLEWRVTYWVCVCLPGVDGLSNRLRWWWMKAWLSWTVSISISSSSIVLNYNKPEIHVKTFWKAPVYF